jgi:hypothetical protein
MLATEVLLPRLGSAQVSLLLNRLDRIISIKRNGFLFNLFFSNIEVDSNQL